MRYIDIDLLLQKRDDWGDSAELWKNPKLKSDFRQFFHGKCWYTEVDMAGFDIDIDHFRPKSEVKPFEKYNYNKPLRNCGYYWLKNEPKNYRGSCIFANRPRSEGGKRAWFPLHKDSQYLSPANAEEETPLLLDPCNPNDVNLVAYSGNAIFCTSLAEDDKTRVSVSTKIYNWNEANIKTSRASTWEDVSKTIDEFLSGDISEKACIRRLKDAVSPKAPFSACAISCVHSLAPEEIKNQLDLTL